MFILPNFSEKSFIIRWQVNAATFNIIDIKIQKWANNENWQMNNSSNLIVIPQQIEIESLQSGLDVSQIYNTDQLYTDFIYNTELYNKILSFVGILDNPHNVLEDFIKLQYY